MSEASAELRQRHTSQQHTEESEVPENPVAKDPPSSVTQYDSDQAFVGFFSAILNATSSLVIGFVYGLRIPGTDELFVLLRAIVAGVAAAVCAGAISWYQPDIGLAVLGGTFLSFVILYGLLLYLGEEAEPIEIFSRGWAACSAALFVALKIRNWKQSRGN